MKGFFREDRINFVDSNNRFVGYDFTRCCCEEFGCAIREGDVWHHFEVEERDDDNLPIGTLDTTPYEGFVFDPEYIAWYDSGDPECSFDHRPSVTFRLTRGDEEIFLVLWNHHNGYYSHGFVFKEGDDTLQSGSL